jgi:hypothetical protein
MEKEQDRLASRHGYQGTWSAGWALGARERRGLAEPVRLRGAAHLVHARIEDVIRAGKDTGLYRGGRRIRTYDIRRCRAFKEHRGRLTATITRPASP